MADLFLIAEARGPKSADVVFFHGLGGDARSTWQATKDQASFWLAWLAEDIDGLSVYSVGYEAPVSNWRGSAMQLSDRAANVLNLLLVKADLGTGEVILAGHSLGGLVIKQLLRKAADAAIDRAEALSFIDRVRKVAFLATPHVGADMAGWGDRLRVLVRPSSATGSLIRNEQHLRDLNLWYRRWARERKIDHLILTETKTTAMFGMIVKPDSSDPGLAVDPVPIDSDHLTIVKPVNRESEIYQLVRNFIERHTERPVSHQEKKIDAVKDDTQAIRENVDRLTAELSMSIADREALVGDLARVKAEHGGTVDLVSGFLETMVGRKVAPEQFASTLFKIAGDWKSAGEKIDALSFSSNLSPRLSTLRDQAKVAHQAGRLDEAEQFLAAIAHAEIDALERLEDHDREVQEEIRLRKRGVADTKAAQAAVAHARLNYRDAAVLYGQAASLVASFDTENRLERLIAAAGELFAQGYEFGDNAALREAIELYRLCLALRPREHVPLEWAATQVYLGIALETLGERETGTARLEEAVEAYRDALQELTRARAPLEWATTQNNLGIALLSLGKRESGTERLEEAVSAYREALKERTRARVPLDWAGTQSNLGVALEELGERESGTARLEEAVEAHRQALKEQTRDRAPLDWARTQSNLGAALGVLGGRESSTETLRQAFEAIRGHVPLLTLPNLGNAQSRPGEREIGTETLRQAVAACREALKELTRERVPLDWAQTQNHLGNALTRLGKGESGTETLTKAADAYREALQVSTRERIPLQWAGTQVNLALVHVASYNKDHQLSHLDAALEAADGALEEFRKTNAAFYIGEAERLREKILAAKANLTPPRPPVPN